MHQVGLTKEFHAIYTPLGMMVETVPWILVGVLIFWKKSDEPFGLLFSLMLVVSGTFSLDQVAGNGAEFIYPILLPLVGDELSERCCSFYGIAFPDGHFVPRWLRWVAALWIISEYLRPIFN